MALSVKTTIYLLRHGEVHNPKGVIYGHLPGYGLSSSGRAEVAGAAETLADRAPFDVLMTSPLQRAQETARIVARRLELVPVVDERLAETDVAGYQGKPFSALPDPYITEDGLPGIEGAACLRARMIDWLVHARQFERVIAVSHRDPIAILLLYWLGLPLKRGKGLVLPTGSVHEIQLEGGRARVSGPAVG